MIVVKHVKPINNNVICSTPLFSPTALFVITTVLILFMMYNERIKTRMRFVHDKKGQHAYV